MPVISDIHSTLETSTMEPAESQSSVDGIDLASKSVAELSELQARLIHRQYKLSTTANARIQQLAVADVGRRATALNENNKMLLIQKARMAELNEELERINQELSIVMVNRDQLETTVKITTRELEERKILLEEQGILMARKKMAHEQNELLIKRVEKEIDERLAQEAAGEVDTLSWLEQQNALLTSLTADSPTWMSVDEYGGVSTRTETKLTDKQNSQTGSGRSMLSTFDDPKPAKKLRVESSNMSPRQSNVPVAAGDSQTSNSKTTDKQILEVELKSHASEVRDLLNRCYQKPSSREDLRFERNEKGVWTVVGPNGQPKRMHHCIGNNAQNQSFSATVRGVRISHVMLKNILGDDDAGEKNGQFENPRDAAMFGEGLRALLEVDKKPHT